jgi:hypothetical protein
MRDDFSHRTLDVLAKRVGVRCSNPGCRKPTTGPRSDTNRIVCIGVGAHITAASRGGKRYDLSLTSEQRSSGDNGIWLCQNCAKLVDNDERRYTVVLLREWKQKAEAATLAEIEGIVPKGPEDAAELVLSVGGAILGNGAPKPAKLHYNSTGHCYRHDYKMAVILRNLGNERLSGYHVDVDFPASPLEGSEAHPAYVRDRSTRTRKFFRVSGTCAPEIFPGDESPLLILPYYIDDDLYWKKSDLYAEPVRVTLYQTGLPHVVVERPFEEFSNF